MRIKHREIEIVEESPFANCKLAREPYARVLTQIVDTYADGFVMAINNEWGTGKTTFVKMWQQHLKNEGFQTIYFNAWENDFESNPLVAIISELETLANYKNKKAFKSVIEKGALLIKNIGPALTKSLIKKYVVDVDEIALDSIEHATKASTEILEEEIKKYTSKKRTLIEFRKELENFIKESESAKPLIFIVDELDRCRPNYAVEVLELIKHFFSVLGIVFVLSIDKSHLASSIKGFYGSEQIDSNEYLRRFIELEYSIPKPSAKEFSRYLFEYYSFNDFFSAPERIKFNEFRNDSEKFLLMVEFLLSKSNITLRQQERVFALTRLVLCSFRSNQYIIPHVLFVLVYLKILRTDLFNKIDNGELTLQELSNLIGELLGNNQNLHIRINLCLVEASLLWFYNNNREFESRVDLLVKDDGEKLSTPINSRLPSGDNSLAECFNTISRYEYANLNIDFFLKKIKLTEPVLTN
jgi:nucleoside-triphosphatase THEP1